MTARSGTPRIRGHSCGGVLGVVPLPVVVVGVCVQLLAALGREDVAGVPPKLRRRRPFPCLLDLVRAQQLDEFGREPDRPAAGARLRVVGLRSGELTARAVAGLPPAGAAAAVLTGAARTSNPRPCWNITRPSVLSSWIACGAAMRATPKCCVSSASDGS